MGEAQRVISRNNIDGQNGRERDRGVDHLLGDFCLCELRIRLLGFLACIHTEEVEGGLVGLGSQWVLGVLFGGCLNTQTVRR